MTGTPRPDSQDVDRPPQIDVTQGEYVAVLGTGSIGMRHLRILQGLASVRPIAIPCRTTRRVDLERQGFITAASLRDAVRSWSAKTCILATETGRHCADSLEALALGLHCLVEKPLVRHGGEGRLLHRKVCEVGGSLYVGCYLRFSEALAQLRIGLNRIGPIHSVRIECQSYLPDWRPDRPYLETYSSRHDEGGVLRDLIHEIDYAGWMFGWPTSLQARLVNTGTLGIAAEESADLSWETKDGITVTIRLDYLTRPSRRRMRVCGRHGTWIWDGLSNLAVFEDAEEVSEKFASTQTRDQMLTDQARAFLAAQSGTVTPSLASGIDGFQAVLVCDAARRSALSRMEEAVEQL